MTYLEVQTGFRVHVFPGGSVRVRLLVLRLIDVFLDRCCESGGSHPSAFGEVGAALVSSDSMGSGPSVESASTTAGDSTTSGSQAARPATLWVRVHACLRTFRCPIRSDMIVFVQVRCGFESRLFLRPC